MTAAVDDVMVPRVMPVRQVRRDTAEVFTLELDPGPEGFAFAPGQFCMLHPFGHGEVPISICGDPGRPEELLHTIRAVGPVTRALQRIERGDELGVRGPFGTAWPVDAARGKDVLFVAGGIGIAPLRPAILHVLAHRDRFRRVSVLYGSRSPQDVLYSREIEGWGSLSGVDVQLTVDRAGPEWRGLVGVVPGLVPGTAFDPDAVMAMICGPEVMIRYTVRALERRGVERDAIWVSLERNMHCGCGLCGHCQLGPTFVCREGPVYRLDRVRKLLDVREV